MSKSKSVYYYKQRRKHTKHKFGGGNQTAIAIIGVAAVGIAALYLTGGGGSVADTIKGAINTISEGAGLGTLIAESAAGAGAGAGTYQLLNKTGNRIKGKGGSDSGKGGSDSGKGGSKPSGGDDFSKVKDPFSSDELSKISPATPDDLPKTGNLPSRFSGNDSVTKRLADRKPPPKPSKTDRSKKSDNKKTHKTNDKKDTKKTPDKPKPKKDCVITTLLGIPITNPLCEIQNIIAPTPENSPIPRLQNPLDAIRAAPLVG